MITLCAECHGKVHAGTLHIEGWMPLPDKSLPIDVRGTSDEDILQGLIPQRGELSLTDRESRRISSSQIWFYQRQRVEGLEKAEARLIGLQAIEEAKARDLWELATGEPPGYTLLDGYSEGETFSSYISGRNISARIANEAVGAYSWIKESGLTWPQGLQLDKVNLLHRVAEQVNELVLGSRALQVMDGKAEMVDLFDAQKWLDGAVDPSYQTVKQNLIDAHFKTAQAGWYFVLPRELLERKEITPVYSRDLGKLLDRQSGGSNAVVRVWGFKRGLHKDLATGGLTLFGDPLPFDDMTKEEAVIDTAKEAKEVADAIISEDLESEI